MSNLYQKILSKEINFVRINKESETFAFDNILSIGLLRLINPNINILTFLNNEFTDPSSTIIIGSKYDPENTETLGSSFLLLWNELKYDFLHHEREIEVVENYLIDAIKVEWRKEKEHSVLSKLFEPFIPSRKEFEKSGWEISYANNLIVATSIASVIITRIIKMGKDFYKTEQEVLSNYEKSENKLYYATDTPFFNAETLEGTQYKFVSFRTLKDEFAIVSLEYLISDDSSIDFLDYEEYLEEHFSISFISSTSIITDTAENAKEICECLITIY